MKKSLKLCEGLWEKRRSLDSSETLLVQRTANKQRVRFGTWYQTAFWLFLMRGGYHGAYSKSAFRNTEQMLG